MENKFTKEDKKAIDEVVTPQEKKTVKKELPEAVASVTYSVVDPNGFPALVTYRAETFGELFVDMDKISKSFVTKNYKPQQPRSGGFPKKEVEYVEGRTCPLCGGRVVKNSNPKGPEFKCENQKFNFATKMVEGCKYADWGKNSIRTMVNGPVE